MVLSTESADANLGNHIRKTPDGNPIPPSYLYNVVSIIHATWSDTYRDADHTPQVELIFEATHVIPITLAKCSILFLYKRIFRGPVFTAVVWTSLGIAVTWGLSYFFTLLFLCTPIPTYLRHGPSAPGVSCSNELQVYYSLSISDFLIDVIILVIPIPFVWRLKMPPRHKVAVTVIFLLGCLWVWRSPAWDPIIVCRWKRRWKNATERSQPASQEWLPLSTPPISYQSNEWTLRVSSDSHPYLE